MCSTCPEACIELGSQVDLVNFWLKDATQVTVSRPVDATYQFEYSEIMLIHNWLDDSLQTAVSTLLQ